MSADGTSELPQKKYYDAFTWLVTQLAFSFCVAPFIYLDLHKSITVWSRVYFYCIFGVTYTSLFLLSPGKQWLQSRVKQHSRPTEEPQLEPNGQHPTLGLPDDPGRAWDEMVEEISAEIDARKRRGQPITGQLKREAEAIGKKIN